MTEFKHSLTTVIQMIKSHCVATKEENWAGLKIVPILPAVSRHGCSTSSENA